MSVLEVEHVSIRYVTGDFKDIGRMVYEKFQKGEVGDTEYISLCEEIEKREEEVEKQEEQIVKIKEEI